MSNHRNEPYMSNAGVLSNSASVGNNISNDSDAINNANSARWEYEEITLERGTHGLGFTVAGGTDNPHYKNDNNIYITKFIPNGPAALDGRLKLEDIIVKVDDTSLIDVKHYQAVSALKNSGKRVQLLIKRKKPSPLASKNSPNNGKQASKTYSSNLKSNNNSLTRVFTSASYSGSNQATDLPPLPRGTNNNSAILRGSAQYATTRESSTPSRTGKLKASSSSQSLQQSEDHGGSITKSSSFKETLAQFERSSKSAPAINSNVLRSATKLPRTVILQRTSKGLGLNIVGGVAGGGTFISYIVPGGAAERSGKLHCGDQILSVNGIDLRFATHEEAATTLKQAGQTVKLIVKYKPDEYMKFENKINDMREKNMMTQGTLQTSQKKSLYARALFDYDPTKDAGLPSRGLTFRFGDILHITNASDDEWWQARRVLDSGADDVTHGIIPSKRRVEKRERARLKSVKFTNRNASETTLDRRRKKFSFSKKFPFMKSRENIGPDFDGYDLNGSRSNSRGILSSSSTMSINNNSERGSIRNFPDDLILSYEPVLQQDIDYFRPVALYGPVKDEIEAIREDLSCDDRFMKMESIVPYTTRQPKEGEVDGVKYHFISMLEMKRDLARHKFVEAGELNGNFYGTSIDSIRDVAISGKHCLLNISPKALKRLHEADLYPITIFIKPKSIEALLEMNKRWSHDEAAAAMDTAGRLEQEFGTYFSATIQSDSPSQVMNEILSVINQHSGPRIWIPTTFEALNVS